MKLSTTARLLSLLLINGAFCGSELAVGYISGSLAMVADGWFHLLNDVISLIIALYTSNVIKNKATSKYSYGLHRVEVLGSLVKGVFLLALCFFVLLEAIAGFISHSEVTHPKVVTIVGCYGIANTLVGLLVFGEEHEHSHAPWHRDFRGHDENDEGRHNTDHHTNDYHQWPTEGLTEHSPLVHPDPQAQPASMRLMSSVTFAHPAISQRAALMKEAEDTKAQLPNPQASAQQNLLTRIPDTAGAKSQDGPVHRHSEIHENRIVNPVNSGKSLPLVDSNVERFPHDPNVALNQEHQARLHNLPLPQLSKSCDAIAHHGALPCNTNLRAEVGREVVPADKKSATNGQHGGLHECEQCESDFTSETVAIKPEQTGKMNTGEPLQEDELHAYCGSDPIHDNARNGARMELHPHHDGSADGLVQDVMWESDLESAGHDRSLLTSREEEPGGHADPYAHPIMRAMSLHVLGDVLGNIGVIITGLFIWLTDNPLNYLIDPLISLVIAGVIFWSAIPLCRDASIIILQAVPEDLDLQDVRAAVLRVPGVLAIHELHIWQLSETRAVGSVHVWVSKAKVYMTVADGIRKAFHDHGIYSCTIQPEFPPEIEARDEDDQLMAV